MRIGIDARFYGPLGKGLGRYTQQLIRQLEMIDRQNDYFIFLRAENWDEYRPSNERFRKVLADYRWYTVAEQIFMPFKIWSCQLDVMHFTHFNVPLLYVGRFIVTIHDLILTKYPTERATTLGPLLYAIKHAAYQLIITSAIRRAKKIIAVSEYTKKEIIEHFRPNSDKVAVTYEAVNPPAKAISKETAVLSAYGVEQPYLLYVGNVYPHKNIEGLLEALSQLLESKPHYQLVLVGKDDYFFRRMKERVARLGLQPHVIFTGFVSDDDLPALYTRASLYVFPSFCEGFGLPALEACLYGLPVVASNSSSLPEVLGGAAFYFNPHRPAEIAQAMQQVLDNETLRLKLISNGFKRALSFSWERMARQTLDLYTHVGIMGK